MVDSILRNILEVHARPRAAFELDSPTLQVLKEALTPQFVVW
jgi:hypothetical protein